MPSPPIICKVLLGDRIGGSSDSMTMAIFVTATGLAIAYVEPAFAEFQIQEASIEKGQVEFEYRGAYYWGVPEATATNENANDTVQSHELELSYGLTNWWRAVHYRRQTAA
jgi:hypothetical protein